MALSFYQRPMNAQINEIRLLELTKGSSSDPVSCSMRLVSLDDADIEYETLSYVLGDSRRTCSNSECVEKAFKATKQSRVGATAFAVQRLQPFTLELIHRMAGNHKLHWADFTPIEDNEPRYGVGLDRLLLFIFFRGPWWTRMWTLQEMAKAKSLTFICGSSVISGQTLELLVQSFNIHYQACCFDEKNNPILTLPHLENRFLELQRIESLRKSRTRVGFLELARLYRYRIATDPHYMVYGLLGMSLDLDDKVINYQLPVAEAYELATLALIAKTGNLDVFSHVLEHPSDASHKYTENLPSWEAFSTHKTSGSIPVDINRVSPGKIAIKGLLFDTVEELAHAKAPSILISYDSIDEWREFAGVDEKPEEPYAGGKTLIDAFWRTLCCDMSVISEEKRATFEDRILHDEWWWIFLLMKYKQNAQEYSRKLRQEVLHGVNQLALSIYSYTAGRRFFRTKTGYIGVGPSGMKEGDQVCVLFGGKTPFILRRKDPEVKAHNKSVEEWIFVGDAYVQGIMNGEAIKSMENEQLQSETFILC
ncbi:uncharacterized protein EAF02_011629 [Botrytis sinoallii]|uniref:uncharacterized protein n=1 Tax=Botrytis sinoallii TaxID=1463999 RepID=UPI00190278C3|nr:uncharacterized protein EAF02_011629 [Botrytis sinoallii]KAF7854454.1 hypothetical protein EAF02_011629 [Botrytis sinoallii]